MCIYHHISQWIQPYFLKILITSNHLVIIPLSYFLRRYGWIHRLHVYIYIYTYTVITNNITFCGRTETIAKHIWSSIIKNEALRLFNHLKRRVTVLTNKTWRTNQHRVEHNLTKTQSKNGAELSTIRVLTALDAKTCGLSGLSNNI